MNTAGIISLLPAAAFSVATIAQFSARSAGKALLADLGLGDRRRRWLQLLLLITAVLLILPQFRVAGVGIAALEMMIFGLSMLNHRQYQYALPALIVLATLPLALPGPG